MEDRKDRTLAEIQREYRNMPYNSKRVAVTLEALALTEQMDSSTHIKVIYDLAWAYAVGDDPAKALPVCADYFALLEECQEYGGRRIEAPTIAMIAAYVAKSLPQITLDQCRSLMEEFHKQVKKYGMGERLWQMHASYFSLITGDFSGTKEHLDRFQRTPRDNISDCEACEVSNTAEILLELGLREEAYIAIQPVFDKSLTCGMQPWGAFSKFIHEALDCRDFANAQELGKRLEKKKLGNKADLISVGALLRLQACCNQNPSIALLEKGIRWTVGTWDQELLLDFYRGAWVFCAKLSEKEPIIPLSVPKKFLCWRADGLYDSVTLAKWFYEKGTEIANRFDKRNGSDYFSKRIKKSEVWE